MALSSSYPNPNPWPDFPQQIGSLVIFTWWQNMLHRVLERHILKNSRLPGGSETSATTWCSFDRTSITTCWDIPGSARIFPRWKSWVVLVWIFHWFTGLVFLKSMTAKYKSITTPWNNQMLSLCQKRHGIQVMCRKIPDKIGSICASPFQ